MSESSVDGPEDAIVNQAVALGEVPHSFEVFFQERFMGEMEAPNSWRVVNLVFLRKPRCGTKEGDQKLQSHKVDINDVKVVRFFVFRLEQNSKTNIG